MKLCFPSGLRAHTIHKPGGKGIATFAEPSVARPASVSMSSELEFACHEKDKQSHDSHAGQSVNNYKPRTRK